MPYTHGMTFSWVARALSGLPFSLTNNLIDVDRNGTLFDPLAPGTYTGAGTIAADNYTVEDYDGKRNGATGPGFFQLDTRFGWRLNVGSGRTLDLSADVFNVTNRANFANPSGNQGAPPRSWCSRRSATAQRRARCSLACASGSERHD